jgi:hypothetical protein
VTYELGLALRGVLAEWAPSVAPNLEEAAQRAAAMDTLTEEGTHLYRCFTRS